MRRADPEPRVTRPRARAWHQVPPPERDGAGFVQAITAVMQKGGYEIVFPAWEAAILCLSTARDSLPGVLPFAGAPRCFTAWTSKWRRRSLPRSGWITATEVATTDALMRWEGPVVLKPAAHHCFRQFDSGRDAVAAAEEISRAGIVPLAQERVSGQTDGALGRRLPRRPSCQRQPAACGAYLADTCWCHRQGRDGRR